MKKQTGMHKFIGWHRLLAFTLAVLCLSGMTISAYAAVSTEQKLEDAREATEKLQKQTDAAKDKLDAAKKKEATINSRIDSLDEDLQQVQQSLADIDVRICEKNEQLSAVKDELDELEQTRQRRYEAMKVRIRFMYENSDLSLLEMLLGAESMSTFLNQMEYFSQVVAYDRGQLEEYQTLLTEVAKKQSDYETQKEELLALKEEESEKQEELVTLIADAREDLSAAGKLTDDASEDLEELSEQLDTNLQAQEILEAQLEYEEQLEQQRKEEEADRMEEIKRIEEELAAQRAQESSDTSEDTDASSEGESSDETDASYSASDLELMACIIHCEAEGEPYEGKVAVGSVVMNRVASSSFPNTIMGVIYQSGQFSPVASGRMAARLAAGANSECYRAARDVLGGTINVPYLFFRRNDGSVDGYVIGHHVFY